MLLNPQIYVKSQGFFDNFGNCIDATEVSDYNLVCNLCFKRKSEEKGTFSNKKYWIIIT